MATEFNYLKNKRRDEMLGTPFTWPTTAYVRLVTTVPVAATPGTEVAGSIGYAPATLLAANMAPTCGGRSVPLRLALRFSRSGYLFRWAVGPRFRGSSRWESGFSLNFWT